MRTKISVLLIALFMSFSATAQLDRSKQPKPGPAPTISLEKPYEFQLDNGLKVLVVENHKLPKVNYSLRIDNPPIFDGDIAGISGILGAMLGNGTTNIPKDEFNEEVDFLGANIGFSSQSAFASSLTKYSERILELMADAAINPLFTQEEFDKEIALALDGLKSNKKSVQAIASRVSDALAYGKNHPYGEFTTEETLNNITLDNVRSYYQKYFNPNNAYLVVTGDIKASDAKKLVKKYFNAWEKDIQLTTTVPAPAPNLQYTQINFVDAPNAVQSNIIYTNNVDLKMNHPDYHAALLANYMLGGGGSGYLYLNLREDKGYTYGSYSSLSPDKYVGNFSATAEVRNEVTDSSVVEMIKEIKRIRTEKVDEQKLKDAKAKYVGNFVMAIERPETIARYALNIKLRDLPEDFYKTYLEKINKVTSDDILRVAQKYFSVDNARIIVVGKGSDVIPALENTKIPVKYYDEYANEVSKPEFSKPIPEGVTAQSVIDNYIKAIGGKEKLQSVNSTHTTANVTIEGAPFKPVANMKRMAPNKMSIEMSIEGMGTLMKQVYNGETGYIEQQGQKQPMPESMTKALKESSLFDELTFGNKTLSLESLTTINGNDVYKVKVEENGKSSNRYYNVADGFLARTETTEEAGGQSITTVIDYEKYSAVDGVYFPYYFIQKSGPQTLIFNVTNVKVNDGVSDADFN